MIGGVVFANTVLQALKSLLNANDDVESTEARIATKTICSNLDTLGTVVKRI